MAALLTSLLFFCTVLVHASLKLSGYLYMNAGGRRPVRQECAACVHTMPLPLSNWWFGDVPHRVRALPLQSFAQRLIQKKKFLTEK